MHNNHKRMAMPVRNLIQSCGWNLLTLTGPTSAGERTRRCLQQASCINRLSLPHSSDYVNRDKEFGHFFITGSNSGHLQVWCSSDASAIDHRVIAADDQCANWYAVTGRERTDSEESAGIEKDANRKKKGKEMGENRDQDKCEPTAAITTPAAAPSLHLSPLDSLLIVRSSNPDTTFLLPHTLNQDASLRSIVTASRAETNRETDERTFGIRGGEERVEKGSNIVSASPATV